LHKVSEGLEEGRPSTSSEGGAEFGGCAPTDWNGEAHFLKLAADQGDADAQNNYGFCLQNGKGVSIDMKEAAHYFKLAADQGNAQAQYRYANSLLTGNTDHQDSLHAIH
jgi:TPR repeat protein